MGADFNKKAYQEIYRHSSWERTADKYEEEFAAKLYKTPYVQQAAKTALTKLSRMLNAYYNRPGEARGMNEEAVADAQALGQVAAEVTGERAPGETAAVQASTGPATASQTPAEPTSVGQTPADQTPASPAPADQIPADQTPAGPEADNVEITDTLLEALLPKGDSSGGAGQIGNYRQYLNDNSNAMDRQVADQIDRENLNQVINGDGNLRERMTMLYNGMFVNGGRGREQIAESRSLKNMMAYITDEDRARSPELQGVRLDLLNGMKQREKRDDVFNTFSIARDLKKNIDKKKGRGNRLTRFFAGLSRAFNASLFSTFIRKARSKEDRMANRLGEQYYERLGLGLSQRERANGIRNGELQWQEGKAWFDVKKRVNAEGMLQTAGPSGTTLRMLGAYKLMGASLKDLLYFRLALIAWMVTSKDHSLYEIMKGSQNAGVTGKEDLSEPATMYMTVDPLPVDVLRQEFAPEHQFPHELVYRVMLNELRDKRRERYGKRNQAAMNNGDVRSMVEDRDYLKAHLVELNARITQLRNERKNANKGVSKPEAIKKIVTTLIDQLMSSGRLHPFYGEAYKKMSFEQLLEMGVPEILALKADEKQKKLGANLLAKIEQFKKAQETESRTAHDLEVFEAQRKYVEEQIVGKREELSQKGYEVTEGYNFTLYGKSSDGIMKEIGEDANNAQAQDIALNIYTTGAYMAMTKGQKYWEGLARSALRDDRVDQYKQTGFGSYEFSSSSEMGDKEVADDIFKMIHISSRMSQDALEERGQNEGVQEDTGPANGMEGKAAYVGRTFRGSRLTGNFRTSAGSTFTINAMTSSSKRIAKAAQYYKKSQDKDGEDNAVLIEYSLKGKGAVDISGLSKVQNEAEVLIPAKTEFKVVTQLRKATITEDGIRWEDAGDAPSAEEQRQENKEASGKKNNMFPIRGYVVRLEEVSGPGAAKREEDSKVAGMRREIRDIYRRRMEERQRLAQQG